MVVVIAKALVNPSGWRRACNHGSCRCALTECSPSPPFLELGAWELSLEVPACPPALLLWTKPPSLSLDQVSLALDWHQAPILS